MKYLFSIATLLCFSLSLNAQDNMVKLMKAFGEKPDVVEGAERIEETVYRGSSYTKETPDTTMLIDGVAYDLYLESSSIKEMLSPMDIVLKSYGEDGSLLLTEKTSLDEKGYFKNSSTEFADPSSAIMNSAKSFNYNKDGKITSIMQNGAEVFNVTYLDDFMIDELSMDGGMMKMKSKSEKIGDTMRYELKVDMGEEFAKMMGDKMMPREYTDVLQEGDNYRYMSYKEDKESEEINLISNYLYDSELNVLEESTTEYGFNKTYKYEYNAEGKVVKRVQQDDMSELVWEYDTEGRLITEPEDYSIHKYTYDENGNVILKITVYQANQESIETLTTYNITYK